jgi:hypothetical protein
MTEREKRYDKSSKWLIQHHGDSILRLAGIENIVSWRPLQSDLVQPQLLPDGLLEVFLEGEAEPDFFLIEMATFPENRLSEQLTRDLMLAYLDRRVLPEVVTVVLRPKGRFRPPTDRSLQSRRGLTRCDLAWCIVELWTLEADDLLQSDDPGLAPWIPLTQSESPPEQLLEKCRDLIERKALAEEKANLLAVTQIMTILRYNDTRLLQLLGGGKMILDSPLIQDLLNQRSHRDIVESLNARFGSTPIDVVEQLKTIQDEDRLLELVRAAAVCSDVNAFRERLRENRAS